MSSEVDIVSYVLNNGGITGSIVGALLVIRYLWKILGADFLDKTKQTAEANIINTMSDELSRVTNEIRNLKEMHQNDIKALRSLHEEEKKELLERIDNLEKCIGDLRIKSEDMKAEALKIYTTLSNANFDSIEGVKQIKDSILSLVFTDQQNKR